jgi:hypothetical protein
MSTHLNELEVRKLKAVGDIYFTRKQTAEILQPDGF